jgi:hypothetical protein
MDFSDKAKIRIKHWLMHNESHINEYGRFIEELEAAGMQAGAVHIREMIAWTAKGNACLREALKEISNRS